MNTKIKLEQDQVKADSQALKQPKLEKTKSELENTLKNHEIHYKKPFIAS